MAVEAVGYDTTTVTLDYAGENWIIAETAITSTRSTSTADCWGHDCFHLGPDGIPTDGYQMASLNA